MTDALPVVYGPIIRVQVDATMAYQVGFGGVTAIDPILKPGLHCDLPYLRVRAGDQVVAELSQHAVRSVIYTILPSADPVEPGSDPASPIPVLPPLGSDVLQRADIADRLEAAFSDGPAYGSRTWTRMADALLDILDEVGPRVVRSGSWRDLPVTALRLQNPMAINALVKAGHRTVAEVDDATNATLLRIPNLGETSLKNVREAIRAVRGYSPDQIVAIALLEL